jgi:hypothetical protein
LLVLGGVLQTMFPFEPQEVTAKDRAITARSFAGVRSRLVGISFPLVYRLIAEGRLKLPGWHTF